MNRYTMSRLAMMWVLGAAGGCGDRPHADATEQRAPQPNTQAPANEPGPAHDTTGPSAQGSVAPTPTDTPSVSAKLPGDATEVESTRTPEPTGDARPSVAASPQPAKAAAKPKTASTAAASKSASVAAAAKTEPTPAPIVANSGNAPAASTQDTAPTSAPAAPTKPATTVSVPRTEHVHVDVPAGLQAWLDADDRMRPWLGTAIRVLDQCYADVRTSSPNAAGVASVEVTMHENARPSARVVSAPAAISGITLCATTRLIGVKMPLFTGKEGAAYTVRVHFEP